MKLYYSKGSCSLVPRIIINEIGLRCDYELVDLKNKTTAQNQDFKKINPKGAVPVIEFKNGEVLTENAVILQFLADDSKSSNLLPVVGDFKRYRVLEWLNYITTELHKGFGPLFNSAIPADIKEKIFVPTLIAKFNYIDSNLAHCKYIAGEEFTLPDAYLFVMLYWAKKFHLDLKGCKNLSKYEKLLSTRPSILLSLREEGLE